MLLLSSVEHLSIITRSVRERYVSHVARLNTYLQKHGLEVHKRSVLPVLSDVGQAHDTDKNALDVPEPKCHRSMDSLLNMCIRRGDFRDAFSIYGEMVDNSHTPSAFTFVALLKACAKLKDIAKGHEIHIHIVNLELLQTNLYLGNASVDMYAKCGFISKAREVFDKLSVHDVVSWNVLIAGYVQHEQDEDAIVCLKKMKKEAVAPDAVTFACGLKACGNMKASNLGREIHTEISRRRLLEGDVVLGATLVDMYLKCGLLENAKEVFESLPVRDVVTWTAIISGYAQHERGEEALGYLEEMYVNGIFPNAMTLASSLKACGSVGVAEKGKEMHAEISRAGLLKRDLIIATALVDMYAKCGLPQRACDVFDEVPYRDIVLWNSLISGYAQLGEMENVLHIFDKMKVEGSQPDKVTFVSVLNACSHAGLVDSCQQYFLVMGKGYGITPIPEHHMCMIDLFGRAGQLEKALLMLNMAPWHPSVMMWRTLLGACRKWGDVELGRLTFEQAVQSGEKEAATYICMYNIFADAGLQIDAMQVESMARERNLMCGSFWV